MVTLDSRRLLGRDNLAAGDDGLAGLDRSRGAQGVAQVLAHPFLVLLLVQFHVGDEVVVDTHRAEGLLHVGIAGE